MGLIHIMERGGDDVRRFEESLKMAKEGIKEACEIFEDMKAQFGEHGSYGERYSSRSYYRDNEHDWDERGRRR